MARCRPRRSTTAHGRCWPTTSSRKTTRAASSWRFSRLRAAGKLTAEQAKDERRLLSQFGAQWVGDLAPLIELETMAFDGGFLSSCVIAGDRLGLVKELTGHPAWGTVTHVHVQGGDFPLELLTHPVMKSLTRVTGIADVRARALLTGPDTFPSWTSIGIDLPHYDAIGPDVELLKRHLLRVFPALDGLVVDGYLVPPQRSDWLWTPQFERLSTVGVTALRRDDVPRWLEVMLARAPAAATLELSEYHHLGFLFRLSRGPDGQRSVLELRARAAWGRKRATLVELASFAGPLRGTLSRIRLHDRSTKAERAALEALLAPAGVLELA